MSEGHEQRPGPRPTHKGPELVAAPLPFLEDMDDEVVIAAAHVIAAQAAHDQPAPGAAAPADPAAEATTAAVTASIEAGREPLIATFLRAHEQKNQRIKDALAGLLAESHWDVKGYAPKVEAARARAGRPDCRQLPLRSPGTEEGRNWIAAAAQA